MSYAFRIRENNGMLIQRQLSAKPFKPKADLMCVMHTPSMASLDHCTIVLLTVYLLLFTSQS